MFTDALSNSCAIALVIRTLLVRSPITPAPQCYSYWPCPWISVMKSTTLFCNTYFFFSNFSTGIFIQFMSVMGIDTFEFIFVVLVSLSMLLFLLSCSPFLFPPPPLIHKHICTNTETDVRCFKTYHWPKRTYLLIFF